MPPENVNQLPMRNIKSDKREITRIEIFTMYSADIISYSKRNGHTIQTFVEDDGVWFVIVKDGKITSRINSKFVSVIDY